jgi:heme-degrading monooxygenase HmoA
MGRIKPGSWPEFETAYRQHIEASPAAGLLARWLVRSTSDANTFFTVSLWDTLAAMETYERSDAVQRQILPHIVPYLNGVSTAHHCQVRGNLPLRLQELALPLSRSR